MLTPNSLIISSRYDTYANDVALTAKDVWVRLQWAGLAAGQVEDSFLVLPTKGATTQVTLPGQTHPAAGTGRTHPPPATTRRQSCGT